MPNFNFTKLLLKLKGSPYDCPVNFHKMVSGYHTLLAARIQQAPGNIFHPGSRPK